MNLETIKEKIPDFAKDIRLNLGSVLTTEGSPDLTINQIFGVALAVSCALQHKDVYDFISNESNAVLSPEEIQAAKAAASIMAMNNIYYRFTYMTSDKDYGKMPARLRMNVIANSGINKIDFELYCLAVSILNGCALCVDSHIKEIEKGGISKNAVQSVARITAVLNAVKQAVLINP